MQWPTTNRNWCVWKWGIPYTTKKRKFEKENCGFKPSRFWDNPKFDRKNGCFNPHWLMEKTMVSCKVRSLQCWFTRMIVVILINLCSPTYLHQLSLKSAQNPIQSQFCCWNHVKSAKKHQKTHGNPSFWSVNSPIFPYFGSSLHHQKTAPKNPGPSDMSPTSPGT